MFWCISFCELPNTTNNSVRIHFPITQFDSLRPVQQYFVKLNQGWDHVYHTYDTTDQK